MYYCKCGQRFGKAVWLSEHVGICNPKWPRTAPEDEHARVTEAEWNEKRNAAYRGLRDNEETIEFKSIDAVRRT